jgi:hypothetical protein
LLSTRQGHHWILEDCTVRHANSVGIDIGLETWHAEEKADPAENGGHIVRRNRVTDCGICGIAGAFNADDCLIENNLLEHIGGRHIERLYETGGMKLHRAARTLIRGNVFRRVRHAPGLWLDYLCRNTRVTGNLFCDIESLKGAVYLEVAQEPNLIDRNVIWDIRMAPYPPDGKFYGHGINVDTGDESILAHNLIGNIQRGHGIAVRLTQPRRQTAGRVGLGRRHTIANNILVNCPERVILSRAEDNRCDGNVYDDGSDALAYCIEFPEPRAAVNLEAWQHFLGFDREACVSRLRVELDADSRELTVELPQALPLRDPVPVPADTPARRVPAGPMPFAVGRHAYRLCPDAPA